MDGAAYPGKRALDLFLIALSAPVTVPAVALTALLVRAIDGKPVFFKQSRAGFRGQPFDLLKFRTMRTSTSLDRKGVTESDWITLSDRARVTKLGRILRSLSIDELPQLLNVLKGDMSIVGPRPLYLRYLPHYSVREARRANVLPGITGYSQIECRNQGGWRERLEYDVRYVDSASLILDLKLIFKTVVKALRSEGVSVIAGETGDALDDERSYPYRDDVYMRRLYARDLATRVDWLNDERVSPHMTLPDSINLETTSEWFRVVKASSLRQDFVFESPSGELLAMTGVKTLVEGGPAEFYVFVNPDRQGSGYGGIATDLTLEWAKSKFNCSSIWLSVLRSNTRALRIYESLGLKVVGHDEERYRMELFI